jgi:hypothetical protein
LNKISFITKDFDVNTCNKSAMLPALKPVGGLWLCKYSRVPIIWGKASCKETLTAAETLLYYMENQDDVDYADL